MLLLRWRGLLQLRGSNSKRQKGREARQFCESTPARNEEKSKQNGSSFNSAASIRCCANDPECSAPQCRAAVSPQLALGTALEWAYEQRQGGQMEERGRKKPYKVVLWMGSNTAAIQDATCDTMVYFNQDLPQGTGMWVLKLINLQACQCSGSSLAQG